MTTPEEQLLEQLLIWQGEFPQEAIAFLIANEQKAKPVLYSILQHALDNYEKLPDEFVGHIYAIYLLAQFRDPKGYALAIKLLSLPGDHSALLLRELMTQSFPSVLASLYDGNPKPIYDLVESPKSSDLSRGVCLVALSILCNLKKIERRDLVGFLDKLLDLLADQKNSWLLEVVAQEIADLHIMELGPKVVDFYNKGLIDQSHFTASDFNEVLKSEGIDPRKFFLMDDIFEELMGAEYSGQSEYEEELGIEHEQDPHLHHHNGCSCAHHTPPPAKKKSKKKPAK